MVVVREGMAGAPRSVGDTGAAATLPHAVLSGVVVVFPPHPPPIFEGDKGGDELKL